MRKLFLSFGGLIQQLHDGLIRQEDLDDGLYFLFCGRGYVLGGNGCQNYVNQIFENRPGEGAKALQRVRAAIAKAMETNRAKWWSTDVGQTVKSISERSLSNHMYRLLEELLGANGFEPLRLILKNDSGYSRRAIAEAIERSGMALEVVGPINYFSFEK